MEGVGAKQGSRSQSIVEKCAIHNDTLPACRQCERHASTEGENMHEDASVQRTVLLLVKTDAGQGIRQVGCQVNELDNNRQ